MGMIIQAMGGKGGVGKSLVCMSAMHSLLGRGTEVVLVETDEGNPDCAKAYENTVQTEKISLSNAEGWATLANCVDDNQGHTVVINTRGGNQESIRTYTQRFWRAVRYMDRRVVTLWVINRDYDSVLLLSDYLITVPRDAAQVVHVVKNLYYSPDGRFPTYEGSKAQEAVEGAGGRSIELPVMATRNKERLYDKRETIQHVLQHAPIGDRVEMECWVDSVESTLGTLLDE